MASVIDPQQDEAGGAVPDSARVMIGEREVCLGEALIIIDKALREGQHVEKSVLRELCVLFNRNDVLKVQLNELSKHWPKWTDYEREVVSLMTSARENGQLGTFIELYIQYYKDRPINEATLPVNAWSVLCNWTHEGGYRTGVALPVWVVEYLERASDGMQRLRCELARPAADRLKEIPKVLGYSSGRQNAFAADHRNLLDTAAHFEYEMAGSKGLTGDARIEVVRKFRQIDDTRTAKLYVAKGRWAAKPPPAWLKK